MAYDEKPFLNYRISRAKETIREAKVAIDNNLPYNAENRIYYAIFYIVSALALKSNFKTSKHWQLLGWFNKNFIKTGKIDVKFWKIYRNAF